MPQAIWTGRISFGLVSVPVRLYPATRRKDVRFHEIDRQTGQRVRHQRVLPVDPVGEEPAERPGPAVTSGAPRDERSTRVAPGPGPDRLAHVPVPSSEVVRGFEVSPDRYVTVDREELTELAPEQTRSIDIEQFVEVASVDPVYFDRSYYAVPERDHVRPYALLVEAMRETNKMAISWFVLRRKRYLTAVRADGDLMVLTTLFFHDEVMPRTALEPAPVKDLTRREREMATLLVDTLAGPFEPERYPDEYRRKVEALLEGRTASARSASPQPRTSPGVEGLMAALQASVNQARADAKSKRRPAARRKRKTA